MKTFKQLLWFIVPTAVISILFIFSFYPAFDRLYPPQFMGFKNYLQLFLQDDVFLKALLNGLVLFELYLFFATLAAFILLWCLKKRSNKIKLIIACVCGSISILTVTISLHFETITGVLLELKIIKEPFIMSPEMPIIIQVFTAVILLSAIPFLFLIKSAIGAVANKKWVDYAIIATASFIGYPLYHYITANLLGYPSADYAAHTIVAHTLDYGDFSFIFRLLLILQITVINCFLFWCGNQIMERMKRRAE